MTVEQLEKEVAQLQATDQDRLAAYLGILREERDEAFRAELQRRIDDKDPSHWIPLEQVESWLARQK